MFVAMPLIKVFTSAEPLPAPRATALLETLSKKLAEHLQKPESYVMTCLVPQTQMTFGGSGAEPACYLEVKNVGPMMPAVTRALSTDLTAEVSKAFGVAPERTYIEFTDAKPQHWSHAGATFG